MEGAALFSPFTSDTTVARPCSLRSVSGQNEILMRVRFFLVVGCLCSALLSVALAQEGRRPLTVDEIVYLLQQGVTSRRVASLVEEQGVKFELTEAIKERLKRAGADEGVLTVVQLAGVKFRERTAQEQRKRLAEETKPQTQDAKGQAVLQERSKKPLELVNLRFLTLSEEGKPLSPGGNVFPAPHMRFVWWEAQFHNRLRGFAPAYHRVEATYYGPNGQLLGTVQDTKEVAPDADEVTFSARIGNPSGGAFVPGSYRVDFSVNGRPLLSKQFTVEDDQGDGPHRQDRRARTTTEQNGPPTEAPLNVRGGPPQMEPRLISFTPQHDEVALFLHQSRYFAVQIEIAEEARPSLRYDWTVNARSVSGREVFEFKDQPLGTYDVTVTIAASFGAPLTRHWRVAVRGVYEDDEIGPLWSPRVEIFDTKDIVTTVEEPVLTFAGKVRNLDTTRSADNVAIWISIHDRNGRQLTRHIAIPTPQPLAPGAIGTFTVQLPNLPSGSDFHIQVIDKNREDEDPQQAKALLLQRADAAKRKQQWEDAEALLIAAMKVYPPDQESVKILLQDLRATRGSTAGSGETPITGLTDKAKRQDLAQ